jgi:hypothetical protein
MPGPTGGIRLQFRTGAYISISEQGVEIVAPTIKLTGVVRINETALVVM